MWGPGVPWVGSRPEVGNLNWRDKKVTSTWVRGNSAQPPNIMWWLEVGTLAFRKLRQSCIRHLLHLTPAESAARGSCLWLVRLEGHWACLAHPFLEGWGWPGSAPMPAAQGSGFRTQVWALPSPPSLGHGRYEAVTLPPSGFPKTYTRGKLLENTVVLEICATTSNFGNNIVALLISIYPIPTSVSQLVPTWKWFKGDEELSPLPYHVGTHEYKTSEVPGGDLF